MYTLVVAKQSVCVCVCVRACARVHVHPSFFMHEFKHCKVADAHTRTELTFNPVTAAPSHTPQSVNVVSANGSARTAVS